MSGMDFNKLFAAILVAAIIAMLSGFIARETVQAEKPEKNAFSIAVTEVSGAGGAAVAAKPEPILALLAAADPAKGESAGKACAACHSFGKGEAGRVGPNLYGIVNAKHAHVDGFAYSDAMKAMHDKTWTYNELNGFLWNPAKHIPGTKMTFAGIKKPEQRADVIAWLRTLADSPAPLPDQSAIDAEAAENAPAEAAAPAADDATAKGEAAKETPSVDSVKDATAVEGKSSDTPSIDKKGDTMKAATPSTNKPVDSQKK